MKTQPVTFVVKINTELSLGELQTIENRLRSARHSIDSSTVDKLRLLLSDSQLGVAAKEAYCEEPNRIDIAETERLFACAHSPLTATDRLYVVCFLLKMSTDDLCKLFNIEPSSTYVVRYGIRHKFRNFTELPF